MEEYGQIQGLLSIPQERKNGGGVQGNLAKIPDPRMCKKENFRNFIREKRTDLVRFLLGSGVYSFEKILFRYCKGETPLCILKILEK
jgi:hypothetical protein